MSEVTVIGLGEMGSALARTLARGGHSVTVFNRTAEKAAPLSAEGAAVAPSPEAAVAASPVVIVCVSSYEASRAVLGGAALSGKLIMQLGTGTPKEARDMAAWAKARGAEYLDGAILAWPSQIGGPNTAILVSGPRPSFLRGEALLRRLAGGLNYMGEEAGSSAALFAAVLSYLAGRWVGLCHGALVCEAEGLGVADFGALLADLSGVLGQDAKHMGQIIEKNHFTAPESTLKTAGEDIGRLAQHAEEAGINGEVPRFAAGLFRRAIEAGYGAEEHAALIKILRAPAAASTYST